MFLYSLNQGSYGSGKLREILKLKHSLKAKELSEKSRNARKIQKDLEKIMTNVSEI